MAGELGSDLQQVAHRADLLSAPRCRGLNTSWSAADTLCEVTEREPDVLAHAPELEKARNEPIRVDPDELDEAHADRRTREFVTQAEEYAASATPSLRTGERRHEQLL